jgi:peptidoglycan/xylan/chitin deacetylase (PgdA/CDA1 family)
LPDCIQIIGVYDNTAFLAPIEYTFDLIFSIIGAKYKVIPLSQFKPDDYNLDEILAVTYGREYIDCGFKKQIHIYASEFFGKDYLKTESMPKLPLKRYKDLPIIYSGYGRFDSYVQQSQNLVETKIDIIASSFFMVSRYEEVISEVKDEHARFPATASLAYREGFLDRPVVNEYIELLWDWIHMLRPDLERKPVWPENKDFSFCLTHDVDTIRKYYLTPPVRKIGRTLLKERHPRLAFNMSLEFLSSVFNRKADPFYKFDYMLHLEQAHNIKSSFFFMSQGSRYNTNNKGIKELISQIENSGSEAGLHGGYFSYNNLEKMAEEKKCIDKIVNKKKYGCRQHFLRWKTPDTWRIQAKLGLLYDTTLSFADHAGFRCGICLPFKPFDVVEGRKLDIWELPLTVMEGSLQNPKYQNLPPDTALKEIMKLCDTVKKYNGVFVLLWHNSSFDSLGGWKGWREVYERFLENIDKQSAWSACGRDIIKWWESERIQQ